MDCTASPETVTPEGLLRLCNTFAGSNRLGAARKFLTLAKRLRLANKFRSGERPSILIYATSDEAKDEFAKLLWGDYWLQYQLTRYLGLRGYPITKNNPDIVVHLHGFPTPMPQTTYNIVWIYSHPDMVTPASLLQYDRIYTLSESFRLRLKEMGFQSEVMMQATAKEPYPRTELKYPAVFLGNARRALYSRPTIEFLLQGSYPFLVWGNGWEQHLPADRIAGLYYDNHKLDRLYAQSTFSLHDHHEDMRKYGFVAEKIFDILASGGFAVCHQNPGIQPIFGDTVPQFASADELQQVFRKYAPGTKEREQARKQGQEIALSHTWLDRAEAFIRHIEKASDPRQVTKDIQLALAECPST